MKIFNFQFIMKSQTSQFLNNEKEHKYDLEERTAKFGERIIELSKIRTKKPPHSGFGDPTKIGSSLAYHPEIIYHIIVSMSNFNRGGDGICTRRTLDDKPGSLLKNPHVNKSIAYENFKLKINRRDS